VNTVLDRAFGLQISKEPENTGNFSRANPILIHEMRRRADSGKRSAGHAVKISELSQNKSNFKNLHDSFR
jgi:hypothetical protein